MTTDSPTTTRRRRPGLATISVTSLGSVFLVLVGITAWLVIQVRAADADDVRQQDVLAAAKQQAVNITSQNYKTIDKDMDRMIDGATGDLKSDLDGQQDRNRATFTTNKLIAKSTASAAGLVTIHERSATVLVVIDQMVTSDAKNSGAQPRHYRLELDMSLVDGRWLASDLRAAGLVS